MIKSMTGYGKSEVTIDNMDISVEIKSVNHRYFEFSSRVPRNYGFLEEKLKKFFALSISRGKVECNVNLTVSEESDCIVELNHSIVKGYLQAYKELEEQYGLSSNVKCTDISKIPDAFVIRKAPQDEEKISQAVITVANAALEKYLAMKVTEGEKLKEDVLSRLITIENNVSFIEIKSPQTVKAYNDRLYEKIKDVLNGAVVDENRILTEAAIFADKVAVAEETVRLRSHIAQMRAFMDSEEAIGKKTDFLVQEMNREANTIGSKAQDIEIAQKVIEIKAEIEKIREQIQNIE